MAKLNHEKVRRMKKAALNPGQVLSLIPKHYGGFIPDRPYLELMYRLKVGKKLHLDNPLTFNEKIQWMKLYDRKPEYTVMVDKVKAKDYVASKIGEEYIIPTLGVWADPEDIDFDSLPDQFVLKCNHNSGSLVICKDKSKLDVKKAKRILGKGLRENYFKGFREWAYKDVPRRILAEKYMVDESGTELKDYKMFCFNGKVYCTYVCSDRMSLDGLHITFYDREWNKLPIRRASHPVSKEGIERPTNYGKMIRLAEELTKDIPFVRCDFYDISGSLYFGELTLYPAGGFERFSPNDWDLRFGEMISLPERS